MYPGSKIRTGFSMKVNGIHLNRPDLHNIAAELGIATRDVLTQDGVLTIYNTSKVCQEIIDDNNLAVFVSMALDISAENISDIQEVTEVPVKLEFDPSEFTYDDDDE
jgi:sulfur transfer complex TusBCD TusB component (DsrH family)